MSTHNGLLVSFVVDATLTVAHFNARLNLWHGAETMGQKGWPLSAMRVLGGIG